MRVRVRVRVRAHSAPLLEAGRVNLQNQGVLRPIADWMQNLRVFNREFNGVPVPQLMLVAGIACQAAQGRAPTHPTLLAELTLVVYNYLGRAYARGICLWLS